MKKIFILIIAALVSANGFAQRSAHKYMVPVNSAMEQNNTFSAGGSHSRTTAVGDTLQLSNIAATDPSRVLYSLGADSGYFTGINYWSDQAFAERYDFNGGDSSMKVIGVIAQFGGTVNPASVQSIAFNVWNVGVPQYITAGRSYSGFPNAVLLSDTVAFTQLGIGTTTDTVKQFLFSSATPALNTSFFIGYSMTYNFTTLTGDTIGLASTMDGNRTSPKFLYQTVISDIDTVVDTLVNVQNATQFADYTWHDNYSDNDSLSNDLAIFPIVIIGNPTGVHGVTKNNLTFFGNYPNPAVNNTNIRFALASSADVTIQIMDINGRMVSIIRQTNLATGEHIVPVNTATMPAGDYLYTIRTNGGAGMAGKMTIVR